MKNGKIIKLVFTAMAVLTISGVAKAEELVDFDGRNSNKDISVLLDNVSVVDSKADNNTKQTIQVTKETVLNELAENFANIPIPGKPKIDDFDITTNTWAMLNELNNAKFYDETGRETQVLNVLKVLKIKIKTMEGSFFERWALSTDGILYSISTPANKQDFVRVNNYLSTSEEDNSLYASKNGSSEWELTNTEEYEVHEISWDGVKKKICRIIKETWCRWVCFGAPHNVEGGCRQDCKEVHKKVCRDE
ncbi:MAG: hypothetical protein KA059_02795 [Elusimicrobiales bacterium]|nr:hypothetical protein [Elusimicrobiales bacterium]